MMVNDADAKTELIKKLKVILHDTVAQETMSQNLKAMAIKDADERIANKIIELAELN